MRVAHVIGSLGTGGGERVALDLAAGQARRGHDVIAVSLEEPPDGPMGADYAAEGIEVVRAHKIRAGVDPTMYVRLATAFRKFRADIVHTHNPPPLIYGAPAARLASAGVVHTKHGQNEMPTRRRALVRQVARLCGAFVAVSETTAAQARRDADVAPEKLSTIENGIDLARFSGRGDGATRASVRGELGIAPEAFVAGSVGRLCAEKNQPRLIAAMAPLLAPSAQLVLVGEGPERAVVERAIAALGERGRFVHLLGARRDTPRLYAAFDAFALSSDSEGLPLVIIEAMASGLPVVSTAVGGIPAAVADGQTGALVALEAGAGGLGAALARLAASPSLGLSWGAEGRRRALARYSRERMVNEYLAVYERVLGKHE